MSYLLGGFLMLFLISEGQAQTYERTQEYCEFEVEPIFGSPKCYARVDYGQVRRGGLLNRVEKLRDPVTGEILVFNSAMEVLNYMNERGWELVQVYVIDSSDARYLLRRPLIPNSLSESESP